ncbi:hypothetical protein F1721_23405 [Saccharopolyspora hirsuta]|uniref:Uncharacterized protein n=1 Tax=Saccharopolyspora hirsuta TaxID=1837 RepID=A0A5M7BK90_SACHI|nr:hypothetical protein F1721_23405 [Saccharopolyspora hirsuta]
MQRTALRNAARARSFPRCERGVQRRAGHRRAAGARDRAATDGQLSRRPGFRPRPADVEAGTREDGDLVAVARSYRF